LGGQQFDPSENAGKDLEFEMDTVSGSNRLIIVHTGSKDGFLPVAQLAYKVNSMSGDYHGQTNYDSFSQWITHQVILNLPPNNVVVVDSAPYNSTLHNKPPGKSANKQDMVDWLQVNRRLADISMKKTVLYDFIEKLKPPEKIYKIDQIFKIRSHTVIRLPPYMCDLNPIELAWAKLKNLIRINNVLGDINMKRLRELELEATLQISREDWGGYCRHMANLEEEYWVNDGLMESRTEQLIINLESDNENSDTDLDLEDDSDSE
jgi:transposase